MTSQISKKQYHHETLSQPAVINRGGKIIIFTEAVNTCPPRNVAHYHFMKETDLPQKHASTQFPVAMSPTCSHLFPSSSAFQTVSVTVSVLTLTYISIDRWYAICFPLRYKPRPERAWRFIAVIWLIGFLSGEYLNYLYLQTNRTAFLLHASDMPGQTTT